MMSVVLIGTVIPVIEIQGFRKEGIKKRDSRKKQRLADYFNLNVRADVTEGEVVETTQNDDPDDNLPPVTADESSEEEDVTEKSTEEPAQLPSVTDKEDQDSVAADEDDTELPAVSATATDDTEAPEEVAPVDQQDQDGEKEPDTGKADDMQEDTATASEPDQDDQEEEQQVALPGDPAIHRTAHRYVDTDSDEYLQEVSINIEKKKHSAIELVHRAADYFDKHSIEESFSTFSHTKDFVNAELYIFGYTQDGVCVTHPHNPELLWENLYEMKDSYDRHPVKEIGEKAAQGGGWVTYEWEGATKLT